MQPLLFDAQLHAWGAEGPHRRWNFAADDLASRAYAEKNLWTFQRVLDQMNAANVSQAALVTWHRGNKFDNSYVLEGAARWPERFVAVGNFDHRPGDVRSRLLEFRSQGMAGVRLEPVYSDQDKADLSNGYFDETLRVAAELELPVCWYVSQAVELMDALMERHPDVVLILDHFGLKQMPPRPRPFDLLDDVIHLARHNNVHLKLTAGPTLSSENYPFADLFPILVQLADAYGAHRLLWGTNWTRSDCVAKCSYSEAVRYLESSPLSKDDLAAICGGNAYRIYRRSEI